MSLTREPFGSAPDQTPVERITLESAGARAHVLTLGATLASLWVPDRDGVLADVVLGFDTLEPYTLAHPYFGSIIGRYANRIAQGRFALDGVEYRLVCNEGLNHLHGGPTGFHHRVWEAQPFETPEGPAVTLTHESPHAEGGYPGTVRVAVTYTLTHDGALVIDYAAKSDRPTVLNLTSHAYFNLAGAGEGTVLAQKLELFASQYLPIDDAALPLGPLSSVRETPFDFASPTALGARIGDDHVQLRAGRGYDHAFLLDEPSVDLAPRPAARLFDPHSGRTLTVLTTEPALQLYTGNRLDRTLIGKGGVRYPRHAGVCLEAQHLPDSPNRTAYPSTVLRPDESYRQRTEYRFSVAR